MLLLLTMALVGPIASADAQTCIDPSTVTTVCTSDGDVIVTFEVTNLSAIDAHFLFLPGEIADPEGSAAISPAVTPFDPVLPGDGSGVATVEFVIAGATGGSLLEIPFALMHKEDTGDLQECTSGCLNAMIPVDCDGVLFVRGDTDQDGTITIADGIGILDYLFNGFPVTCVDVIDSNDSGNITITDAMKVLCALFCPGAPPPPAPFPNCGTDPTPDSLDCAAFPLCP